MTEARKALPARPNLGFLKKLAKEALKKMRIDRSDAQLAAAQLVVAREHGFKSWRALKQHVETLQKSAPAVPPLLIDEFLECSLSPMEADHRSGSLKRAELMLKDDPRLSEMNIFAACATGNAARVGELVEANRDLASTPGGPRNWTPILYLCYSRFLRLKRSWAGRFVQCAKILLDAGADPNSFWVNKELWRETALYGAAGVANCPRLTKLLLDRGAILDEDKETLYHAAEFADNKCLALVLAKAPRDQFMSNCMNHKMDMEDPAGLKLFLDRHADPNIQDSLAFAIRRGRSAKIISMLLEAGANPNGSIWGSGNPLTLARRLGHPEAEKMLRPLVALRGFHLRDEIIAAIVAGHEKRARRMLEREPDFIQSLSEADQKLLPHAAGLGNLKGVRTMLDLGWDIETIGEWGGTALHHAVWHGRITVAKLLMLRGAKLEHQQQWKGDVLHTAIHAALHAPHQHGMAMLALVARRMRGHGLTPYIEALHEDANPKVKRLLEKMAKMNSKQRKTPEWKPLMDACFVGDAARVEKLLNDGADPNVLSTTAHRYRPLHRAIEQKKLSPRHGGHDRVVKLLLRGGADPKLRATHSNLTALQLAAMGETRFAGTLLSWFDPLDIFHAAVVGNDKRVGHLLGSDPSLATSRDANNWTALHYCAASAMHKTDPARAKSLVQIAKWLVKKGADVMAAFDFNNEWPLRPLYFACGYSDNPEIAEILLKAGADPCDNESVYHAADEGHEKCLALIEKYVDPAKLAAECTKCLPTQLHWGRVRGAKWLLEHGADPNKLNSHRGRNALHEAVARGLGDDVVKLLLKFGADTDRKTADGKTPLQLAKKSTRSRLAKLLK